MNIDTMQDWHETIVFFTDYELNVLAPPCTDLHSQFEAYCLDTQQMINVDGENALSFYNVK